MTNKFPHLQDIKQFLILILRCAHNRIFTDLEPVLQSMQEVLRLLEAKNQPTHGFKPYLVNNFSDISDYSDISDEDLRRLITDFIQQFPNSGIKSVGGYLNSIGIK